MIFPEKRFFYSPYIQNFFFQKSSGKHNQRIMNGAPSEIKFLYTRNLILNVVKVLMYEFC